MRVQVEHQAVDGEWLIWDTFANMPDALDYVRTRAELGIPMRVTSAPDRRADPERAQHASYWVRECQQQNERFEEFKRLSGTNRASPLALHRWRLDLTRIMRDADAMKFPDAAAYLNRILIDSACLR